MATYQRGALAVNKAHNLQFIKESFIHVRCVDEQGAPLAEHAYEIKLPDETVLKGKLDADGWAKHDHIRPGDCLFKLVDPLEQVATGSGNHFLNVIVKDEEGRPLAGEEYVLTLADGKVRKGKLDNEGRCLAERIPSGACFFALKGKERVAKNVRHLRLQFMDEDGQPFANLPFEIELGAKTLEGLTNHEGRVIADIPMEFETGELTIWLDAEKSGESYTWPIKISEVAS